LRRSSYLHNQRLPLSEKRQAAKPEQEPEQILTRGDIRINLAGRVVTHHQQPIKLSARLFDLLVYLARHQGMVVSRQQLIQQVCQEEGADTRQVDVYIHWLREKLEDDPAHPEHIQTVRGVGYRFQGE
jgi:two-component system alkaline phosphatase synthesis response regulator PhoP